MKALVTVELQLCGDLFFSLCGADGIQHQLGTLLRTGLIRNNTVVIEITDDRKIQHCFGVAMDAVPFQPNMYSAVAVGTFAFCLTFPDFLCQRQILCRDVHAPDIVIVSAAGCLKEAAHLTDAVFLSVTVDYFVFELPSSLSALL